MIRKPLNRRSEVSVQMASDVRWVDRSEYPFASNHILVDGGRLNYVDEGPNSASPIVLVHGTPTWSFLWRHVIKEFAGYHRVIAPDHIGFGLSDKPADWSYDPEDHAGNLTHLIQHLDLDEITLVLHDWGGPIGLAAALENIGRVRQVVVVNTFAWPLTGMHFSLPGRLFGGSIGDLPHIAIPVIFSVFAPVQVRSL